jgi:hypothetical protein
MNSLRKSVPSLLIISVSIPLTCLLAQPAGTSKVLLAMGANAKQVVQYTWKQRVTVVRKGKPAQPLIDQVGFDSAGQMKRTTISAPEQPGGIRGKVAAGVKENVKEIMELAGSYNKPQEIIAAVKKAQVYQTPGGGAMRLQANDLLKPGDAITMLINPTTNLATHIDIKTTYDGGPMAIAQDYSPLSGGPNVMKTMKVSAPGKDLVVNVESYDYARQTAQGR